jgi:hypothetical protein
LSQHAEPGSSIGALPVEIVETWFVLPLTAGILLTFAQTGSPNETKWMLAPRCDFGR